MAIRSNTSRSFSKIESGTGQWITSSVMPSSWYRPAQSTKASSDCSGFSAVEPCSSSSFSSSATSRPRASQAAVSFAICWAITPSACSTGTSAGPRGSPYVTQPCPYSAASRNPFGPVAAT